jgi:hypothetical protein
MLMPVAPVKHTTGYNSWKNVLKYLLKYAIAMRIQATGAASGTE